MWSRTVPSSRGDLVGLSSPNKAPTPQIETLLISGVLVNFVMSSPLIENFLATVLVPHENADIYPKNKPTKNARNQGNVMKRLSELHKRAINCKKRSHCHLFLR